MATTTVEFIEQIDQICPYVPRSLMSKMMKEYKRAIKEDPRLEFIGFMCDSYIEQKVKDDLLSDSVRDLLDLYDTSPNQKNKDKLAKCLAMLCKFANQSNEEEVI